MTPAERLARAEWTRREDLPALVDALGADEMRYVGGCVRDALLGLPSHDVDAATRHEPRDVMDRLAEAGIKTVPTGLEHGTVSAILPLGTVEITTLRHDVATDGRHAEVAFTSDWKEDAARRDFTINALYAHPTDLSLSDYFGGLDDLAARQVRFIGDAATRIREDFLRILRFFRFHARFASGEPDAEALAACTDLAPSLQGLSRERVGWELRNLLALPDPAPTVRLMHEVGVLGVILPEADEAGIDRLAALSAAERAHDVEADAIRRLGALLPADRAGVEQVAARLRLSKAQKKRMALTRDPALSDESPRALAYRRGREIARDRVLIAGDGMADLVGWEVPEMSVKGGDIVAAGVGKGPEVSILLQRIEARWIEEGFPGAARTRAIMEAEIEAEANRSAKGQQDDGKA